MTLKHAKEQALKRYNLDLTDEQCWDILHLALKTGTRLYQKDGLGRIIKPKIQFPIRVNYQNEVIDIVVSNRTGKWHLVTFLPKPKDDSMMIKTKKRVILEGEQL